MHGRNQVIPTRGLSTPDLEVAALDALESLAFGMVAITSRAIEAGTKRGELTFQQWRVLVVLGAAGEGMRVRDLAARIAASGPSTSRIVRRLQTRSLLETTVDPGDGRAVLVRLSGGGASLRERIVQRRRALIQETIASHETSPAAISELSELAALLARWI